MNPARTVPVFTTLLESRRNHARRTGGMAAAAVAHGGLVLALLHASVNAAPTFIAPRAESISFQQPAAVPEPPPQPGTPGTPPRSTTAHVPPVTLPTVLPVLPAIDLERRDRIWREFMPHGTIFPSAHGRVRPPQPPASPDSVYTEPEVEWPAVVRASTPPVYPDVLRRAGVEGEVLVSFVVDTMGRADMTTYTVMRATHELFARAVRASVARERFQPAEVRSMKVRQLVQQPFTFTILRR